MTLLSRLEWPAWVARYEVDHQHPVNRSCHIIGIPLVAASIATGLLVPLLPGLWMFAAGAFVIGWAFQLIGHRYEGRRPSFTRDPRFLLVGLGWWFTELLPELVYPQHALDPGSAAIADRVFSAQVELLYRLTPASLMFSLLATTLVWWLLLDAAPKPLLAGWWCLMLVLNGMRLLLVRAYRQAPDAVQAPLPWARRFVIGAVLNGSLWGLCGVVLLPRGQTDIEFALIAILGVIPGIAFSSMSSVRRAYMGFVAPFLLPIATALLLTGKGPEFIIGVAAASFFGVTWIISTRGERDVVSAFTQRFQNEDLMVERQLVAAQLLEAKDTAERANRAKSLFLANMSHEIRTPMNGVLGMTELLQRTPLSSRQQRYVEVAHSSGQALLSIINDVLDFSKIEAGRVELECIPFSPVELADGVHDLLSASAAGKGLAFECAVDRELPARLAGDPTRIRQVLLNLAGNAIKFTQRGQVSVRLRRAAAATPGRCALEIVVRDTGIGISDDARASLFSSFTQADNSTTRRFGGTGLGLAITRQLVELMGGRIDVHSREGEGSEFTVHLELPIADAATASSSPADPAIAHMPAVQGTVLVVEDNPVNALLAEAMLQELGCRVLTAENGEQALTVLQTEPVQLVLMDCQMPVLDGFAATARVRTMERERGPATRRLPIVALTANAIEGDRETCLRAGMDDYLAKPFAQAQLLAVLARWLPREGSIG